MKKAKTALCTLRLRSRSPLPARYSATMRLVDHKSNNIVIIIPRAIFIVLSIRRQPYARVHCGSSGRKSVSARWTPTRRPGCKHWPLSPLVSCCRPNIRTSQFVLILNHKVDTHLPCMRLREKSDVKISKVFEIRIRDQMENMSWTDKMSNDEKLDKIWKDRWIMHTISKRETARLGHVLKIHSLLKLAIC